MVQQQTSLLVIVVLMMAVPATSYNYWGGRCSGSGCSSSACRISLLRCPIYKYRIAAGANVCALLGRPQAQNRPCTHNGQSAKHGETLTGPTHTCECWDSTWRNCVVNAAVPTIVENAVATPQLSTLVTVLKLPEYKPILDVLSGAGPFTVFAPTNDAFAAAGVDLTNVAAVSDILKYHVVPGAAVFAGDLQPTQSVTTAQGTKVLVEKKQNCADKAAPACLEAKAGWQGFTCSYAKSWCNHATWGPGAQDCCPKTCNACPVEVIVDNSAKVVVADVRSSNGVVHVIDRVLNPSNAPASLPTIVENAIASRLLTTLVTVLTLPEYKPIYDVLSGPGPFTVFAPTNEAFALAGVDLADVAAVSDILKYHVVSGAAVYSSQLQASQEVTTVQGTKLLVRKSGASVTLNDNVRVVAADVPGSNGVVHVIDQVLSPLNFQETCVDKPSPTCLQAKPGWRGFTCAYAKRWCTSSQYGAAAQDCCPKTCGVCK